MKKRTKRKNPAVFAVISFVSIIGVSFMLVFSAVASSNSVAAPAKEVVEAETEAPETTAAAVVKAEPAKTAKAPAVVTETEAAAETAAESQEEDAAPEADEAEEVQAEAQAEAPAEEPEEEFVLMDDTEEDYTVDYDYAVITSDQVNFRSAPDADDDSNIIYVLYSGSTHTVLRTEGDWTVIYVDGFGEGYVYSNYVSLETDGDISSYASIVAAADGAAAAGNHDRGRDEHEYEAEDTEEDYSEPEETGYEYAFITDDGINFRSEPDAGGDNIICMLNYGTTGYYLDSYDGWINVYIDGYGEGYVSSAYVSLTNDGDIVTYSQSVSSSSDDDYSDEDYEEEEYVDPTMALRWEVANYAMSFAGWLPYVWGSHSLEYGADCSGFTSAVYAQFGYSLSCDSEVQSRQGYSVPLSEILPGDIIVYSGHVAMYVGDGLKVHAPYPGTVVTIDSAYYTTILDVRRIIG